MSTEVAKKEEQTPAVAPKAEVSASERFTAMVLKEASTNFGELKITSFQRKLCQNYFIKLDSTLKELEQKRLGKKAEYQEAIPYTWEHVNMAKLSQDVISFSSVGLDPCQKNHINLIPYGNSKTKKYDIGFIIGYVGLELKAKKYGYQVPDDVIVEVVFSNDVFKPYKKDKNNPVETYEYDQPTPFDRGGVIGGFYYHNYIGEPQKSKLRIFSLSDIEKRRPDKAAAEFWGGTKDKWENGKKTGKETIEGWFEEMCYKTISRAAYDAIAIDSEKIDEAFLKTMEAERIAELPADTVESNVKNQITSKANKTPIAFEETTFEEVPPAIEPAVTEAKASELPTDKLSPSELFEKGEEKPQSGPGF